jgi:hypothetical protein
MLDNLGAFIIAFGPALLLRQHQALYGRKLFSTYILVTAGVGAAGIVAIASGNPTGPALAKCQRIKFSSFRSLFVMIEKVAYLLAVEVVIITLHARDLIYGLLLREGDGEGRDDGEEREDDSEIHCC